MILRSKVNHKNQSFPRCRTVRKRARSSLHRRLAVVVVQTVRTVQQDIQNRAETGGCTQT